MVIYGTKIFIFQMIPLMLSNLLITMIVHKLVINKRMRMLTELAILLTTDSFVAFNMVSIDNNFILGYQAIAIIGAYIVLCAMIILAKLFIFARDKLRRMLAMRRYVK